jgi:hypothetical protein
MESNEEINDGHYLELMDRIHVLSCTLDDHILNHPISLANSDVKYHLEIALDNLLIAYSNVGYIEDENNTHK